MNKRQIITCLAAAILSGCGDSGSLPDDASPEVIAAVEACRSLGAREKQDCYEERVLAVLDDSGVRSALEALSQIAAADVEVQRDAHVYTHAIGITSYDPARPVSEVFAECTELFQSGCYHGVIQAHFMATGIPDAGTVEGLCEDFKRPGEDRFLLFQCLHGLGHGLTMYYGHHLPRALEDCDLLADGWDRESCYGGAFMENVVAATSPHHVATELAHDPAAVVAGGADSSDPATPAGDEGQGDMHDHGMEPAAAAVVDALEPFEPLRPDDPHYPCSVLQDRYLTACYLMQTSVMLHYNGGDFGEAADDCSSAPEPWRRTCFQSLGRDVSAYTLQDHARGIGACREAPEEYRDYCYVGLVKNYIDITATTGDGFAFCTKIEERYKPRCNEAIGEQIGTLYGSTEERRQACTGAETPELERRCRAGARVPTS
ncbi:MAG: hypothetical protein R3195_09285 [Gemmatimonadota bacterium]|nr:hypothetical protein [Gemmatimonadota bacterium]